MAAFRLLFRSFPSLKLSRYHQTDQQIAIETALHELGRCPSNTQNLRRLTSCLIERGANMNDLIPYFTKRPELIHTQSLHWIKTIKFFKSYGCNIHDTLSIIGQNPGILPLSSEYLLAMLTCLQNQGISSSKIIPFIQQNPQIFHMSPEQVSEKTIWLRTVFSYKDSVKIINSCPNILLQSDEMLKSKVGYILKFCGVERSDIVNSYALRYSLDHIYTRHEFLCRTGHYSKPKPGMKPQLCKNPPLKLIWAPDDQYFAEKVARVSLDEYLVFCMLPQHQRVLNDIIRQTEVFNQVDEDDESGDESDE